MKKSIALLGIATFAVVLTTGCGGKTKLVCNQTKSGIDVGYNLEFNGNKVEAADFYYDMDLSKYSDTQVKYMKKQNICKTVKSLMNIIGKDVVSDCTQKDEDKRIKVSAKLDIDKMLKSESVKFTSIDETEKALEKQGYKCEKK